MLKRKKTSSSGTRSSGRLSLDLTSGWKMMSEPGRKREASSAAIVRDAKSSIFESGTKRSSHGCGKPPRPAAFNASISCTTRSVCSK
jgi:hypothetical protein